MVVGRRLEPRDHAEATIDVLGRQELRRHAERVADRQAVQSAQCEVQLRRPRHCPSPNRKRNRKCCGSSRLSTCSIQCPDLVHVVRRVCRKAVPARLPSSFASSLVNKPTSTSSSPWCATRPAARSVLCSASRCSPLNGRSLTLPSSVTRLRSIESVS